MATLLASVWGERTKAAHDISDDELIDLVSNNIKGAERERLLDKIAESPDAYERWVRLLRTTDSIEHLEFKKRKQQRQQKKRSFKFTTPSWLKFNLSPAWYGATFSSVALVCFFLLNQPNRSSDALYEKWKPYMESAGSAPAIQWRGSETSSSVGKDAAQQAFETGLASGLNNLGEAFQITHLPAYKLSKLTDESSLDLYRHEVVSGEVSALLYFMCSENQVDDFYSETEKLLKGLPKNNTEWTLLTDRSKNTADKSTSLCDRNAELISKLIYSNTLPKKPMENH